jgi:hypothetical protein
MSYRHADPDQLAAGCRIPFAVAALAVVATMAAAPATAATTIAPGSKVTLPDVGITFTAPPLVKLSDVKGASLTWVAPMAAILSMNQPTTLEFAVDASLADCEAWAQSWRQRLAAPGSPDKQAGLMVLPQRAGYMDERWSRTIVANTESSVIVSNYALARWEFCLARPKGGVVLARTAGSERNIVLMMHGPSIEIATALYGGPAAHTMAVDSVPMPASQAQEVERCDQFGPALLDPQTHDEVMAAATCRLLDRPRAENLTCRYGYWVGCMSQGDKAREEGDFAAAAILLQRACDLGGSKAICADAKDAQQQAEAAGKR